MEQTPSFHPLDHISLLRRRMWWLIIPAVVVVALGAVVITLLPRTYSATATLGISLPTMNGQVVSEAQRLSPQERVRNFNQLLLSPPVLERVVKEEGLDKTMPMEAAKAMIGSTAKVSLPPIDPNVPQYNVELFYLNFNSNDASLSARVTNRLAQVFVDESSKTKTVRAEETSAFIQEELKSSADRLGELEAQLRKEKEGFMGSLPEQTQSNVALATAAQQQLAATSNALRGEQERLSFIEREISGSSKTLTDPAAPGRPAVTLSPKAQRVVDLERELATKEITLAPKHPDIIDLKDELQKAKAAAAAEAALPEDQRQAQMRTDPGYTQLLKERQEIQLSINNLQRQQQTQNDTIAKYMSHVDTAPRVEQALAGLQRETDLERQKYTQLTQKLNDARITEKVEQNRGSEHFTIVAKAGVPVAPDSPNVPRLMIMVVLLALCFGGALAMGREYLDRSIYDARALNDLELPVLGEIPRISHV